MIVPLLYLLGIVAAELVTALVNSTGGIFCHIVLLFLLILHSSRATERASQRLYLGLALAPLIRILSLSLPLAQFSQIYWYLIISVPLFIAILIVVRILELQPEEIGLTLHSLSRQGLVALTGVGFGFAEYYILRPEPLISSLTLGNILLPAIVLLIATGLVEELVFRGVMQRVATEALGSRGWVYVVLLFSVLQIGYLSVAQWDLVLMVGLFYGWVVKKTGSILGVTLSHGITNIMLYAVLPLLLA